MATTEITINGGAAEVPEVSINVEINGHIPARPPLVRQNSPVVRILDAQGQLAAEWPLSDENVSLLNAELARLAGPLSVKLGRSGIAILQDDSVMIRPREGFPSVTLNSVELQRVAKLLQEALNRQ